MIRGICSIALLSLIFSNFGRNECFYLSENGKNSEEITSARVFITISSLLHKDKNTNQTSERNIELNWYNLDEELIRNRNIWISLYTGTEEPNEDSIPEAKTSVAGRAEGSYSTNISYPYIELNITEENNYCTGYWIALIKETKILTKNCYRARPNWMYEMKDTIGFNSLVDLMIPGTHNAGSYSKYEIGDEKKFIKSTVMCHDENIWNQLMYGIRFLDLRVMHRVIKGSSEVFWISHSVIRMNLSVRDVLRTVKKFLQSTREIIIIDFHIFHFSYNDKPETYRKLMKMIEEEIGEFVIPRSYGYKKSLNELWKTNKRLFVGFSSIHGDESLLFFPGVRHLWGNVDNLRGLNSFLNRTVCYQSRNTLWSAMAELTPSWLTHLFSFDGLRKMAQEVNLEITRWFRDRFWNCANIVSTDYFLGNDIINVAIEANKRRFDV